MATDRPGRGSDPEPPRSDPPAASLGDAELPEASAEELELSEIAELAEIAERTERAKPPRPPTPPRPKRPFPRPAAPPAPPAAASRGRPAAGRPPAGPARPARARPEAGRPGSESAPTGDEGVRVTSSVVIAGVAGAAADGAGAADDDTRTDVSVIGVVAASARELRDLCEEQLRAERDPERAAQLHHALGRIYETHLEEPERALGHYEAVLRHAPGHVAVLRATRRVLRALGRPEGMPALFDAEVQVTREPVARARLLFEKAQLLETLGQPGPALAVCREALALDPGNVEILRAVARGQRRDGDWAALAETLAQLADAVTDDALRAAWIAERARLTETRLGDPGGAAALYEAALDDDPHASAALAHVKRLRAAGGRWRELVAALRREHGLCRDADTRQGLLRAIARVQERHLRDGAAAVRTLEEALAARPEDASLLRELARLRGLAGDHAGQAEALARLVERTEGAPEVAALCHRIATLHEQRLRDADAAVPWLWRALGAEPTHRGAADALARLLERREDWAGLLRVLSGRAAAIADPAEQAQLHHRIGHLLEARLGRPAEAVAQHRRALGLAPDHPEAFVALERLLAEAGRWRELAELYERAVERAPHDAEAIAWLFRLGGIREDRLEDAPAALAAYERILERDPRHLGALHAVRRAAERAGRFERAVEALRAEAELTRDAGRRHALRHRAAVLTAERLGDAAGAERALEALLAEAPRHRDALETLARLKVGAGKWEALVAVYGRLLPLLGDRDAQVRLHHRMGEIREVQLGRDADAIASYRQALALDPGFEPAREALLAALERTGAWEALAEARRERLERLTDPEERARAATELGALHEERLNDPEGALASYERALEAAPLHRPALDARERLLAEANDWAALASALEREAAASEDAFVRTQAALRAALVHAERGSPKALDAFRPVFAAEPEHVGALLAVEAIYERADAAQGAAASYERLAGVVKDERARLAALAELARARARRGAGATGAHRRILELAPEDPTALEGLAAAARRAGDVETQLEMHGRLAAATEEPTEAAFHQSRVGELLLAEGAAAEALAAFRAAAALDPADVAVARWQTTAARAARDPEAMQRAARHEHRVTRDRDFAVRVLLEAASLHAEAGREDEAAGAYEEALELDPDHPEAAMGLMASAMRGDRIDHLIERLGRAARAASDPGRRCVLHLCVAQLQADLCADLPAAVAATRRALSARPSHEVAHAQLATYLERDGQWREAVEVLEASLPRVSGAARVDAHLRLARIQEHRLRAPDAAMESLRAVLAQAPDHPEALTALARLERLSGRGEEALALVRRLFEVVADDDARKAAALAEMAELEKARGQLAEAAAAALDAVEIQGPTGPAARIYRGLIERAPEHASVARYGEALLTHLARAKRERVDLPATYRELARVLGDAPESPERLVPVLAEGVEVCPADASIALALVRALRRTGQDERALAELRRLLGVDVLEVGAWRALADLVQRRGEPEGAAVAFAPLVVLGQASAEEEAAVRARPVRAGAAPPGILAGPGLEQLAEPGVLDASAASFVRSLGEILTKLEGIEYERWGVSKRERIRPGEPHALRAVADRIGRIFGAPEFDLFVVRGASLSRTFILAGSPPALLVPAALEQERDAVLAFHLGRPLALLSRGLHPLDHVDDVTLECLLVGAVRQLEPGFRLDPLMEEADLEEATRRVAKAVGFFSRGRLQEASSQFAAAPTHHLGAWARAIRRLAARAALLVADDLVSVLATIGEELGPDNYASDLARFWVGDAAFRFRRAVAQQARRGPDAS